jgi:hypothetical protein
MTELRDKIERWCREESLEVAIAHDDEGHLGCDVSMTEPPLTVSVRSTPEAPGRVLLTHTFEFAIPDEPAGDGAERFAALCEGAALARSALLRCTPSRTQVGVSAEIVVTLFEDGLSKLSFLTGLDEVRKIGVLLGKELEAASLASGVLAEVQGIIAQSAALVSQPQAEAQSLEPEGPPAEEAVPPAAEPMEPPVEAEMPVAISEEPVQETPGSFCPSCGFAVASDARFCRSCGARLEAE